MIKFDYVILLTIYEEHLNENVIEFLIDLLTNQYQYDVYLYNNQILMEILQVVHDQ
jgi:predicted PilT family ATPase